jgi:hypothetical protein
MEVTFVTAFIDLQEEREKRHTPISRFNFFDELSSTGIHIHLFLSESYRELYDKMIGPRKNIYLEYIELDELTTYTDLSGLSYTLPLSDSPMKDTAHYHIINNAKIELVERAIKMDVFSTDTYAWIDFSIGHMFQKPSETLNYIKSIKNTCNLDTLYFPGCWKPYQGVPELFSKVSWRFCGSFFIGGKTALLDFHRNYRIEFRKIVKKYGILPWEVNIWHYMETKDLFRPVWYLADHNDSVVRFSFTQ